MQSAHLLHNLYTIRRKSALGGEQIGGQMKRTKSVKWRMTAILIACIAAYATQDDNDGIAKGNTLPAKCSAANQPQQQPAAPLVSESAQERECALIRNAKRHAQV